MPADAEQLRAIEYPFDGELLAIGGGPGTGKSLTLLRRALRAGSLGKRPLVSAASERGVAQLRARLAEAAPRNPIVCEPLSAIAFEIVIRDRLTQDPQDMPRLLDDVSASQIFEKVGAQLFSLEWDEFVSAQIDPEITGMRAPERFSAAAYRLIRKLRAAQLSPEAFRAASFRAATRFYANPPNFCSPDLLLETPQKYRDSLNVDAAELKRQHQRELDLVRVLVRLYETYVDSLVARGCLTAVDALYEATLLLQADRHARDEVRARFDMALVDDAQDLMPCDVAFLEAAFGERLAGVTLAGDRLQATRAFAGARGDQALKRAAACVTLSLLASGEPAVAQIAARVLEPAPSPNAIDRPPWLELYRTTSLRDEAHYVAATAARLVSAGVPPSEIAVITRHLRCAPAFIDALLERNLPVDVAGDLSLYEFRPVQDGLAALWALADPYQHDRLLRNLEAPWLNLSDASIATLCGDAPEAQALLFELPEDESDEVRRRWDRKRDLRLGRNVVRGDADAGLSDEARARLGAFRRARERWEAFERRLSPPELARTILAETVLATAGDDARGRFTRALIARLIAEIEAFASRRPLATLDDFLAYADAVAEAEADLIGLKTFDANCIRVLDVEAAKGSFFGHAFVVDVRAGAFPRYYTPDTFLFTPSYGMIPKENVGDVRATRTAKFTYLLATLKFPARYYAQERRAFYCAATRARERLYVSASGRATRARSAPELFEELRGGLRG